jgi:hypothetical protein
MGYVCLEDADRRPVAGTLGRRIAAVLAAGGRSRVAAGPGTHLRPGVADPHGALRRDRNRGTTSIRHSPHPTASPTATPIIAPMITSAG